MKLMTLAIAPVIIIAFYIYIRDKYEKEPLNTLLKALISGIIIVIPVIFFEGFLMNYIIYLGGLIKAAYNAFVVAAFSEELFKYLAFVLIIWKTKDFNEKFDGIVYAVYISLGFALAENLKYVFNYGYETGIIRAFTAVPAHALFGVIMGYHFGLAKFYPKEKNKQLIMALLYPIILHGIYDFILMSQKNWLLVLFIPFLIYIWVNGFKKIRNLSDRSIFKNNVRYQE